MSIHIPWEENWQPTYKITFGTRERIKEKKNYTIPASIARVGEQSNNISDKIIPSEAITLSNLNDIRGFTFEFESNQVASSAGSSSEASNLTLYNLTEEQVKLLNKDGCVFHIELGFQGKTALAYIGDVVDVVPVHSPPQVAFNITLSAGSLAMGNTMINTVYDESLSEQDIIIDMVGRFSGLSLGSYGLEQQSNYYRTGGTGFTGSLVTNFDRIMAKNNLQYSVMNGKVVIIPYRLRGADYDHFARTNYTLDIDSIKSITESSDRRGQDSSDAKSNVRKLTVNTFFLPVEIGQFITIPSHPSTEHYAGTYVVKGRRIIAQSQGGAWDIVLDVESIV